MRASTLAAELSVTEKQLFRAAAEAGVDMGAAGSPISESDAKKLRKAVHTHERQGRAADDKRSP